MRTYIARALLVGAGLLSGCASDNRGLVFEPVGPSAFQPATANPGGSLVVFSAFDPTAHFNGLPYHHYHTDYKILSEEGKLLQKVHNDSGTVVEGPVAVSLPPGRYRVVARSNGYGTVTMPVIIEAHQTTTVHLEAGGSGRKCASVPNES